MSRVKGKDTLLERIVRSELYRRGYRFRKHLKELPGKPDIVFTRKQVAVYVDGDFWHGYRLPQWEKTLTPFWRDKIKKNRERDRKTFARMRAKGWIVIRLWGHQIEKDLEACIDKIVMELDCR